MNVDRDRLNRALNPRTVLVVGDKGPNYQWLSNLSEFKGQVYSVQLDEKEIPGIVAKGIENFTSVLDVPGEIDLLICAVPRQVTPFIVADAAKKNVGGIAMFTSGFAEIGDEVGLQLHEKVVGAALAAGMPLIGPNCMGVYNRRLGVKFSQQQEQGDGGNVGIISQSGALGGSMTVGAQKLGLEVTRTISIGNAAVISEADYLEYLRDDPDTEIILMYLEGLRDGRRFASILRDVARRKPVIVWRGGRTAAGARAVQSHTASLASDDLIWDALMRQSGAIAADSLEEALDTLQAVVRFPRSSARGLGLVAMSGGQSVAITDQFQKAGFDVPALTQRSYERLGEFFSAVGAFYPNPLDASSTVRREGENLQKILEILAEDANIDGVAIEMQTRDYPDRSDFLDQQTAAAREYQERTGKPVVVVLPERDFGAHPETVMVARYRVAQGGVPAYPSFARGAQAFARAVRYWSWRDEVGS